MDKEIIEKSLKTRMDLFKIYITVIILLITGVSSLALLPDALTNYFPYMAYSPIKIFLIIVGVIFLFFISGIAIKSYIQIVTLINKLEKS